VLHSQFSLAELRLLPVSLEMSEELSGRPVDGSVRQPRRLTRSGAPVVGVAISGDTPSASVSALGSGELLNISER
jgi:hypothetical protein